MPAHPVAGEIAVRKLQEAVARLHEDIARVELWAGALGCFAQPVPDYDPDRIMTRHLITPEQDRLAGKRPAAERSRPNGQKKRAKNGTQSG